MLQTDFFNLSAEYYKVWRYKGNIYILSGKMTLLDLSDFLASVSDIGHWSLQWNKT